MKIAIFFILLVGLIFSQVEAKNADDCRSLMLDFISKAEKKENVSLLKNNWSPAHKKQFLDELKKLEFKDSDIKLIIESLNMQTESVSPQRVRNYLTYVLSLNEKEQKIAILDLAQLDGREIHSRHVKKFTAHEKKIQKYYSSNKLSPAQAKRYQELYYGCRALRPNEVNANAARDFKRFNLSLNLGTLGASYAFYNMDKEINGEWFAKLGYDIGITVFFTYVGGIIQTKPTDTQIVKSLKSYFVGRAMGFTDVVVYDPMFNNEEELARKKIEDLKKDPNFKEEVEKLLVLYNQRSLYREYKNELMSTLKNLPDGLSLGVAGNSIDENNIDWNNLTHADLDRPEVQEVLVAAAMAQVYQEVKGDWIETDDLGLDRYAFNTVFYGLQIPKSIVQNFITYRMLCMGQDNPKLAFTKAVLFNVSANFIVNQGLYGYREKAINQ